MEGDLTHAELFVFGIIFLLVVMRACMYDQETIHREEEED